MIIYGVFIKERCIYVGCTSAMDIRAVAHRRRFSKLFADKPEIRVLKKVSLAASAYAEWSMIKLYKEMGQADFNSEPAAHKTSAPPPYVGRKMERALKILELVKAGHPRKEIGALLNVAASEITKVCRGNGIYSIPGRKRGSGVGFGIKLNRVQHEEILRRDERNIPHAEIGKLFGVSRERIRQICELAGHPTRRKRQRERIASERAQLVSDRKDRRFLKKVTPTAKTLERARLWQDGKTLREMAVILGQRIETVAVRVIQLRTRHPELFPYRRPEHLRWKGMNLREHKQAA